MAVGVVIGRLSFRRKAYIVLVSRCPTQHNPAGGLGRVDDPSHSSRHSKSRCRSAILPLRGRVGRDYAGSVQSSCRYMSPPAGIEG